MKEAAREATKQAVLVLKNKTKAPQFDSGEQRFAGVVAGVSPQASTCETLSIFLQSKAAYRQLPTW